MKTRILAMLLMFGSLFITGCGFIFVARSQPETPGYCYDCHRGARWHRIYARCGYYQVVEVRDGYKYRPYKHAAHQEYRFVKYDRSHDHQIRNNKERSSMVSYEKEERSGR